MKLFKDTESVWNKYYKKLLFRNIKNMRIKNLIFLNELSRTLPERFFYIVERHNFFRTTLFSFWNKFIYYGTGLFSMERLSDLW